MKIELHMIQNFAPSCLNRDDTGSPKDCDFGGHRRARVSSQCFKRSIRSEFESNASFINEEELSTRTLRLRGATTASLVGLGRGLEEAEKVFDLCLAGTLKLKGDDEKGLTQYLLFVPRRTVEKLAAFMNERWDDLLVMALAADDKKKDKKEKKDKEEKKKDKKALSKEDDKRFQAILFDSSRTPGIALFGRMIADDPEQNVEAASQVAHAISTHSVAPEFDFFTAVDDLQPRDSAGAGMMGTVAFNSACLYRYAVLDVDQLMLNLAGNEKKQTPDDTLKDLIRRSVEAFIQAAVRAIPTGKQNSMAAHNLPSFVMAVVRSSGAPVSLANAFVKPVRPGQQGLVAQSIDALSKHFNDTVRFLGVDGIEQVVWASMDESTTLENTTLAASALIQTQGVNELVAKVTQTL